MLFNTLRKQLIRFTIPASWSGHAARMATSLENFARTEADSAWQMLQAARQTHDTELQVALIDNALEELGHAALFRQAAHPYRDTPAQAPPVERQPLCTQPGELADFMAYQFVGEREIHEQFERYVAACPDESVRQIFATIEADEDCHQADALSRLYRRFVSVRAARRSILRASLRRDLECVTRIGHALGNLLGAVVLLPLYAGSGLLFSRACRQRLQDANWYRHNAALASLRRLD